MIQRTILTYLYQNLCIHWKRNRYHLYGELIISQAMMICETIRSNVNFKLTGLNSCFITDSRLLLVDALVKYISWYLCRDEIIGKKDNYWTKYIQWDYFHTQITEILIYDMIDRNNHVLLRQGWLYLGSSAAANLLTYANFYNIFPNLWISRVLLCIENKYNFQQMWPFTLGEKWVPQLQIRWHIC